MDSPQWSPSLWEEPIRFVHPSHFMAPPVPSIHATLLSTNYLHQIPLPPPLFASSTSTQPQVVVAILINHLTPQIVYFQPRGCDARSLRAPCPANRPWCGGVHPLPCTSKTQHASSRSLLYQCAHTLPSIESSEKHSGSEQEKEKTWLYGVFTVYPHLGLKLIFSPGLATSRCTVQRSPPCPLFSLSLCLSLATQITPAYWPILLDPTRQLSSFGSFHRLD